MTFDVVIQPRGPNSGTDVIEGVLAIKRNPEKMLVVTDNDTYDFMPDATVVEVTADEYDAVLAEVLEA